jgi:hypothetical protein
MLIGVIHVAPAIGGPAEFPAGAREEAGPKLVLEPMALTVGLINGEPLLVAAVCASVGRLLCPCWPIIYGAPKYRRKNVSTNRLR